MSNWDRSKEWRPRGTGKVRKTKPDDPGAWQAAPAPRAVQRAPTLADMVLRETYRPEWTRYADPRGEVRALLASARKFVLTDDMSTFMADLAYASLPSHNTEGVVYTDKTVNERAHNLLNGMRAMARLPHRVTWIEFNAKAKATRARDEYKADLDVDQIPERCGWLIMQHPTLETAYRAVAFSSHTFDEHGRSSYHPQPCIFAYAWRSDEGPPPWPKLEVIDKAYRLRNEGDDTTSIPVPAEAWLTGILDYTCDSVTTCEAFTRREIVELFMERSQYDPLQEMSSDLRYLWALLATIDRLPTSMAEVRASKGFVAKGSYKRFMDHTTITLKVPTKHYRKVASSAIAPCRRKRHMVRGHWRLDRHHPIATLCDHVFQGTPEGHVECTICHGRRLFIKEHERGDASLGFVLHDYVVTHD